MHFGPFILPYITNEAVSILVQSFGIWFILLCGSQMGIAAIRIVTGKES
jgi:hypothetical protein